MPGAFNTGKMATAATPSRDLQRRGFQMARRLQHPSTAFFVLAAGCILASGCKPAYPKCDNDSNCNTDGHKGVCIDGTCQECGKDGDCAAGFVCRANKCMPKPECENDSQCPN